MGTIEHLATSCPTIFVQKKRTDNDRLRRELIARGYREGKDFSVVELAMSLTRILDPKIVKVVVLGFDWESQLGDYVLVKALAKRFRGVKFLTFSEHDVQFAKKIVVCDFLCRSEDDVKTRHYKSVVKHVARKKT